LKGIPGAERSRPPTSAGLAESERTVTLLIAAECRDKAEQKMAEAANNPALRQGLIETAKAWLELADKIEQAEALEAQAKGK
jgi:hypothetical protein